MLLGQNRLCSNYCWNLEEDNNKEGCENIVKLIDRRSRIGVWVCLKDSVFKTTTRWLVKEKNRYKNVWDIDE